MQGLSFLGPALTEWTQESATPLHSYAVCSDSDVGKKHGEDNPLTVGKGQRLRMQITNETMMLHPMHIHGHTWSLPGSAGLRKDTVLIKPMGSVEVDLDADNPGTWALHCHNIYHAEAGMMIGLLYRG